MGKFILMRGNRPFKRFLERAKARSTAATNKCAGCGSYYCGTRGQAFLGHYLEDVPKLLKMIERLDYLAFMACEDGAEQEYDWLLKTLDAIAEDE